MGEDVLDRPSSQCGTPLSHLPGCELFEKRIGPAALYADLLEQFSF
jgi:hypothetical protein